ncbi:hypothetical protein DSECCO2_658350 [anaerobic digester metagenome]
MNRLPDNDLDRLFAEKLDDFRVEPPERSWKKVAAGITITTTVSATALSNLIRPVVWSLSTIATIVLVTVTNPSSNNEYAARPMSEANDKAVSLQIDKMSSLIAKEEIPVNYFEEAPSLIPVNMPVIELSETEISEADQQPVAMAETENALDLPEFLALLPATSLAVPQISWQPQLLNTPNLQQQNKNIIPAWFELSYQTGPDIVDFGMQNNDRITSLGINNGIDLAFHFSDFYLRTGVSSMNLIQRNQYDYALNEYQQVGEFTMVDSMSFIQGIDSAGIPYLIPQYYTSSHPVYDSVAVDYSTKASDKYQYLEIPFSLGVQKDIRRFSLYAQGGFSYAFLLNASEKTTAEFYEETGNQPLSWQSQSLSRNKDFWSFTLAAGVLYNANTRLSFGVEPTYRYCLSPFYAGEERLGQAPVSYGLKFRLVYKLSY